MNKLILVIDDAASIREIVGFTLKEEGYSVISACDGEDALSKLDGTEIDLMICDVNMPKMDGIEFLKTVQNDSKYSSYRFTPRIMLTTEAGENKKEEGKKYGAKAWMVKPFKPEQLIQAVKILLK